MSLHAECGLPSSDEDAKFDRPTVGELPCTGPGGALPNRVSTSFPILCTVVIHPVAGTTFEASVQDYKEIHRIRKDLVAVRSLAKRLLDLPRADWNDWEIDFLQHMT